MSNRRKFNAAFRAEAVELVISSGRPISDTNLGRRAPTRDSTSRGLGAGGENGTGTAVEEKECPERQAR